MKKLYVIFLLFLSLQRIFAQTLEYVPFPMDSASWWSESSFGSYESSSNTTYHYFFKSLYESRNGHQYSVLFQEYGGYSYPKNVFPPRKDSSYSAPQKYALLREENKRVYMMLMQDTVEKVLYDFNLSVNDSLLAQNSFGTNLFKVTQMDSIWVKNRYRKRYIYTKIPPPYIGDPVYSIQIVEGIGSITNHVVNPFEFNHYSNSMAGLDNSFLSFCQKGEQIYGTANCVIYLPKVTVPYRPFPTANVKWFAFYRDYHDFDTPPTRSNTALLYTFNGEVFSQSGNEYHALVEESGTSNFTYYIGYYDSTYQYNGKKVIGGFREKDKKVYFWDLAQNKERLVYDFTLAKGDTLIYEGRKLVVLDTAYTVLDGKYYQNFLFKADKPNSSDTYRVIGGLGGNQFAPHLPYTEHYIRDANYNPIKDQFFEAFCENGKLLWKEYYDKDCNAEIPKPALPPVLLPEETLSPNPTTDKTHLLLKNMNGSQPQIEIYDAMGKGVKSLSLEKTEVEIEVQDLPNGIYFVRYTSSSEQRFIGKMWVRH